MRDWSGTKTRHGTPSGWTFHKSLDEDPCDACYRAKQEYDRRYRLAPEKIRTSRIAARAQRKAEREIVAKYPEEYRELYLKYKKQFTEEAQHDVPDPPQ